MRTTLAFTHLLGDVLQCTSRLSEKASNISLFGCDDKSHWCQICNNENKNLSPFESSLKYWILQHEHEEGENWDTTKWTLTFRVIWYEQKQMMLEKKKQLTHTIVSYTPPMTIASFHERLGFVRRLWNDEGSGHKVTSLCAFPKDIRSDQLGSTARNFGSYTVWTECSTVNISPWHASHCPWSQSDGGARKSWSLAMNS